MITVDFVVVLLAGVAWWYALLYLLWYGFERDPNPYFWMLWPFASWLYLAVLKPSPVRTVGFRLANLKIVNLRGQRPSVLRMTFRLMLWMFGPFNLLFDLMWMGPDADHQSLRDCFSGTCVVRNDALPLGEGPVHLVRYTAMGMAMAYPRVVRPRTPAGTE